MPKKPDQTPDLPLPVLVDPAPTAPVLINISGFDPRLPAGLQLGTGSYVAEVLPDGRVVPQDLPPAILARYYGDLIPPPVADLPPPPTVEEV